MRPIPNWRKVRKLTGYLAGRVQSLKEQAYPKNGRWVLDSGKTLKTAIDEEFKRAGE